MGLATVDGKNISALDFLVLYSIMFYWRLWSGSRVSKVSIMHCPRFQLSRPPAPPYPPKSMLKHGGDPSVNGNNISAPLLPGVNSGRQH